jgi:hypothetical protein
MTKAADYKKQFFSKPLTGRGSSTLEKFGYGLSRSTWLGGELFRMGKAKFQPGDYRENIQRLEAQRLESLKERYPDITPEDASSVASLIGEGVGLLADPAMFGTLYLAAPAKGSALTRLGMRAKSAGIFGAEGAFRSATYQASRGEEIDPTNVLLSTTLGGGLGALFPMVGQRGRLLGGPKEETVSKPLTPQQRDTKISFKPASEFSPAQALKKYREEMGPRIVDTPLSASKEQAVHNSLLAARNHPDMPKSLLENVRDIPNNNEIPAYVEALDARIKQERLRRTNKEVGALSDKEFTALSLQREKRVRV